MNDLVEEVDNLTRDRISDIVLGRRSRAQTIGAGTVDADPAKAAKSMEIGRNTGAPALSVYEDFDAATQSYTSGLVSEAIGGDEALQNYVDSDPMASRVSAKDWGVLGRLSSTLSLFVPTLGMAQTSGLLAKNFLFGSEEPDNAFIRGIKHQTLVQEPEALSHAMRGLSRIAPEFLKQTFLDSASQWEAIAKKQGENPNLKLQGPEFLGIKNFDTVMLWAAETLGSGLSSSKGAIAGGAVGAGIGAIAGPGGTLVGGATGAMLGSAHLNYGEVYGELIKAGVPEDAAHKWAVGALPILSALDAAGLAFPALRILGLGQVRREVARGIARRVATEAAKGGAAEFGTEGAQTFVTQATVSAASGKELFTEENLREIINSAAAGFLPGLVMGGAAGTKPDKGPAEAAMQETMEKLVTDLADAQRIAEPYIAAGQEPPVGAHWFIDKVKKLQIGQDSKAFDEIMQEAGESETKQLSPEMFSAIPRFHAENRIQISAEAIRKLYGDKQPEAEDGILGWVPGIAEQLAANEQIKGDVSVPMADYIAFVPSEVHSELKESIRFRPNGLTLLESKEEVVSQAEMVEAHHGSPHEFDAFSMEKIGTGEGAQSYGHGLYFAENPAVAESYAPDTAYKDSYSHLAYQDSIMGPKLRQAHNNVVTIMRRLSGFRGTLTERNALKAEIAAAEQAFRDVEAEATRKFPSKRGSMYKVRLHVNKEDLLDWDKQASQQLPAIQEKLKQALGDLKWNEFKHADVATLVKNGLIAFSEEGTSKKLREAGIPGIKYLDQGSRAPGLNYEVLNLGDKFQLIEYKGGGEKVLGEFATREEADAARDGELSKLPPETYNFVIFDESLIEIIERNGQIVRSVREASGFTEQETKWALAEAEGAKWQKVGGSEVLVGDLTTEQITIAAAIEGYIKTVAPGMGEVKPVKGIRREGEEGVSSGLFTEWKEILPTIHWVVDSKDVYGTARHEVLHFLRRHGLIKESEWAVLTRAARDGNWIAKYNIERDYPGASMSLKLEEAIARHWQDWNRSETTKAQGPVQEIFAKILEIRAAIKKAITQALGRELTADDVFAMMESGEVGRRSPRPRDARVFKPSQAESREQPELPGLTRIEDRPVATGKAFGITQKMSDNWNRLMANQRTEDKEYLLKRAQKAEARRQTKEWREAKTEMEERVMNDLEHLPQIAAAMFFREGIIEGVKLEHRPKIDIKSLTPEQRKALPFNWTGPGGISPNDAAELFGFPTGEAFINSMIELEAQRGKSSMREHIIKLVDAEVERRMTEEHGELKENILAEAVEHVYGSTQMDMLHELTLAAAANANLEFTFSKDEIKAAAEKRFLALRHKDISSSDFMRMARKAGLASMEAALKGDWIAAYKEQQSQYISSLMVKEAMAYERAKEKFDSRAKKLGRDKIKSMDREFVDFGQRILLNLGLPISRSEEHLQESMERSGFAYLDDFVAARVDEGFLLTVAPPIAKNASPKLAEMTVEQFYEADDAVKSMIYVGRLVTRDLKSKDREEFVKKKDRIVDRITQLPPRKNQDRGPRFIYQVDAMMTRIEEVVKDLDSREELGPLWKVLIEEMVEAKHLEFSNLEALTKRLKELRGNDKKWIKTLNDKIPNQVLIDPLTGAFFPMTRQHMINIMMNWGTESGIQKFTEGYGGKNYKAEAPKIRAGLEAMFAQHATKEDWQFVQNILDIFEGWRKDADDLYYSLGGVSMKWLPRKEMVTPHGTFRGGYFPVIKDRLRKGPTPGEDAKAPSNNALFGPNYFSIATANRYMKERTADVHPIDFLHPTEMVGARMMQIVHDISYRRAVMQAARYLRDKDIRHAISKHYGQEYLPQFDKWLKDVANYNNLNEEEIAAANTFLSGMRTNLITHALGFNSNVILSPDVGLPNRRGFIEFHRNREANMKLVLSKSRELEHTFRNMNRDYRERLEQLGRVGKWSDFQLAAMRWGFAPTVWASQQFRMATFYDKYNKALAEGKSEGDAIHIADSFVRERHGTGAVVDLPAIMRGPESRKMLTLFYGFFNMMYNWMRQVPGNIRRGEWDDAFKNLVGSVLIPGLFGAALFVSMKEKDSWWKVLAKGIALQPIGAIPFAREVATYMSEGYVPSTVLGSMMKAGGYVIDDAVKLAQGKKIEKPISHLANVAGLSLGLPMGQAGRTSQFLYDVAVAKQKPKDIFEFWRGLRTGEAKLRKK